MPNADLEPEIGQKAFQVRAVLHKRDEETVLPKHVSQRELDRIKWLFPVAKEAVLHRNWRLVRLELLPLFFIWFFVRSAEKKHIFITNKLPSSLALNIPLCGSC
jgi:hypothetical protein